MDIEILECPECQGNDFIVLVNGNFIDIKCLHCRFHFSYPKRIEDPLLWDSAMRVKNFIQLSLNTAYKEWKYDK